jgi:hypothetical protein
MSLPAFCPSAITRGTGSRTVLEGAISRPERSAHVRILPYSCGGTLRYRSKSGRYKRSLKVEVTACSRRARARFQGQL